MGSMWFAIMGLVGLYVFYRVLGTWLLPWWSERRLRRFKERFLRANPQLDATRLERGAPSSRSEEADRPSAADSVVDGSEEA